MCLCFSNLNADSSPPHTLAPHFHWFKGSHCSIHQRCGGMLSTLSTSLPAQCHPTNICTWQMWGCTPIRSTRALCVPVFPGTGLIDGRCTGIMPSHGEGREKRVEALQGHGHIPTIWFRMSPHWDGQGLWGREATGPFPAPDQATTGHTLLFFMRKRQTAVIKNMHKKNCFSSRLAYLWSGGIWESNICTCA